MKCPRCKTSYRNCKEDLPKGGRRMNDELTDEQIEAIKKVVRDELVSLGIMVYKQPDNPATTLDDYGIAS